MWEAESEFTCEIMLRPVEWAIFPRVWLSPMGFCAFPSLFICTEKETKEQKKNRNGEWQKRKKQSEAGLEPAIFSSGGKCLIIRPHGLFLLSSQLHIRESIRLVSEAFEGKYVEKKGGRPA